VRCKSQDFVSTEPGKSSQPHTGRETGRRTTQQIVMVIDERNGEAQIIRGILKKDGKIGKVDWKRS
jgi:hypothetical protein